MLNVMEVGGVNSMEELQVAERNEENSLQWTICMVSRASCMSLPSQWEGDVGIIAKEAGSDQAQYPFNDFRVSSFLSKDRNGDDQVHNCRKKGSEEITPGPVDALYVGVQATQVQDKEQNCKVHLHPRQRVVYQS